MEDPRSGLGMTGWYRVGEDGQKTPSFPNRASDIGNLAPVTTFGIR